MSLPRISGSTIVKLLIACFVVGLVLAVLEIDPMDLLRDFKGTVESIARWSVDVFGWAFSYILLGAVIVVPIWVAVYLLRMFRNRA